MTTGSTRRSLIFAAVLTTLLLPVSAYAQFAQQGSKLVGTGNTGASKQGHAVAVSADGNTAVVGALGDNSFAGAVWIFTRSGTTWSQQGNKLVGTGAIGSTAQQGMSVAISADGNTVLAGGLGDNGNIGAAWVFTRTAGVWSQQGGKLVGTLNVGNSQQGYSVALSADGNTAIVGGTADNGSAGAAWVFTRSAGVWTQQGAKLVGSGAVGTANQGGSVALSGDGNTAIVGGTQDNSFIGAAWIYTRSGGVWTQQGTKRVGSGAVGTSFQGRSVALSNDGNTALIGGSSDNANAGAVWVWTRSGITWTQQGLKLVGTGATGTTSEQGFSVSLSSDGNKALIGAYADNSLAGATWVFTRSGSVWSQQGLKLVGTGASGAAQQGQSVSLSADGFTAVIGGEGDAGNVGASWIFVVPASVPDAPTGVAGTPGNTQVMLTWTAPASNGSAITGYQVQVATSAGGTYSNAAGCATNSTTTACTATGLINGTQYFFKVAAINGVGTGPYSAASAGVTPLTIPGAPTGITRTPGNTQVALSWTAPVSNGGSAITGYQAQVATSIGGPYINAAGCPTNSTTPACTATGLTNGVQYFFQVAAINAAGTGAYSTPSSGVTPRTVPGAPTGVSGAAGLTEVALSWAAPASNGGSAITGYQAQVAMNMGGPFSNAAGCPTNSTTPACTVTGLANGTQYFFQVAAINAAGTGAFSAVSAGVTPGQFTDTPLVAGVTPIKAIHVNELRTRVNALRTGHGLGTFPFTDTINSAMTIQALHILELRTALHAVYLQMMLTPPTYATTPAAGVAIVVADIQSLRTAVQAIE